MLEFIQEHYETPKQRRKLRVYEAFVLACQTHEPPFKPPSRITFCQAIKKRSSPERLAIWTLEELYSAFCEWAYSVYDQRLHPALGNSPHDAIPNY